MKRFFRTLSLAATSLLAVVVIAAPAAPALAYNPLDTACSQNSESAACSSEDQNTAVTGPNGIILRATKLIAGVAGVAAVIIMIVYGIQLVTSYGDSGKATTARNGMIATVVGLAIILLAQAIVVLVVRNI